MKRLFHILLGASAAAATLAFAQDSPPEGAPRLEFRTIPVEGALGKDHKVTPYRLFDKVVVTVWDPVACGQKPLAPTFAIQGDVLILSYTLSPAAADAKPCTLVSEFDVLNAPHRDLEIRFAGGPEPYTVATMRRCPYYKPVTGDIWECLSPERQ